MALVLLKNPQHRGPLLVWAIISESSDNASNNVAPQEFFQVHISSYNTRWTTRLTCAAHSLNLKVQNSASSQINMSTGELGTPIRARRAFKLPINSQIELL
ncbi:hypothetical protein C8F04DRAFT_1196222 [Mycena alexandri]|uniref:Uncharacterized protein n=1 Tax=Mycena alexandri TaxID=1745969 RepID=A0AAD6S498_9AGAR|nr:hypothetical protein C8F04DRAFT_1196222 [Mycena alexandri]